MDWIRKKLINDICVYDGIMEAHKWSYVSDKLNYTSNLALEDVKSLDRHENRLHRNPDYNYKETR